MAERRALGTELRTLRVLRGLTVVELARRIGVSRVSLHRWESGEHEPGEQTLARLFQALEAEPQERGRIAAELGPRNVQTSLVEGPLGAPVHPGHLLRAMRESREISQAVLAERIGISRQAIAKWEAGQSLPNSETLARVSIALGVEDLGLREGSLDLYDPIVDPYDARMRLRAISDASGPTIVRLLAVERELWPLAARDPRWEPSLAETLSLRSWAHFGVGEFSAGAEAAQRALRLAQSSNAWNRVHYAVDALHSIREKRKADPSRLLHFARECAEGASDPFAHAHMLNRAAFTLRKIDPRHARRLFARAERLIREAEPTEFTGVDHLASPLFEGDLDHWALAYAIWDKDVHRATELYEGLYASDLERHLEEGRALDVAEFSVEVHRFAGERPPGAILDFLELGARAATQYWQLVVLRRVNGSLGLPVPNVSTPR